MSSSDLLTSEQDFHSIVMTGALNGEVSMEMEPQCKLSLESS